MQYPDNEKEGIGAAHSRKAVWREAMIGSATTGPIRRF
jgi:hypothetical protein